MLKPLAALFLAALSAPAALACSCAPCAPLDGSADTSPSRHAFVGELISIRRDAGEAAQTGASGAQELIYLFHVTRPIKGDVPKYVVVRARTNPVACGTQFSFDGLNAVVVSRKDTGEYTSNSCLQMCWMSAPNRALVEEETVQTQRR